MLEVERSEAADPVIDARGIDRLAGPLEPFRAVCPDAA